MVDPLVGESTKTKLKPDPLVLAAVAFSLPARLMGRHRTSTPVNGSGDGETNRPSRNPMDGTRWLNGTVHEKHGMGSTSKPSRIFGFLESL